MLLAVWSVKGGVGATSVAAILALAQVEHAHDVLLVDLRGDIPAVLGIEPPPNGPGVAEWSAHDDPDPHALNRIAIEARPGLRVLPRGVGRLVDHGDLLCRTIAADRGIAIVDCGLVAGGPGLPHTVVGASDASLLVVRECFLNLRAAQQAPMVPTGVVVIKEPNRYLGRADVEAVTRAPVCAEIAFDSSVARSLDAGLLRARLPRPLLRSMGQVLRHVA